MVVDDSAVIRGFITRYLEDDPALQVVSTASNGAMAVRALDGAKPEVVVLDIEMPEMDGLEALPKMIAKIPDLKVVMASTLTRRNAEVSLKAMRMGAADYVPKPETTRNLNASIDFRRELVEKVKVYAEARRKGRGEPLPRLSGPAPSSRARAGYAVVSRRAPQAGSARPVAPAGGAPAPGAERQIALRAPSRERPEILALGSSTGGPQALMTLLKALAPALERVPVVLVQHMPATFTAILAEHLGRASGLAVREAADGAPALPGQVLVAPGNWHMRLAREGRQLVARLDQDAPVNFCRPSVDPLFASVSELFGARALGAMLTGMGHDGLKGARGLVAAGGTLVAQDELSSIVWGMPGAVATAGLCAAVEPLTDLAPTIARLIGGRR